MKKHKQLLSLIGANKPALLYILVINVLLLVPATLEPVFKQVFADDILAEGASDWMFPLLLMMIGTALLSAACTWLQKSCMLRLSHHVEIPRVADYMWRLFHAPLSLLQGSDSAVLLSQAHASQSVSGVLTQDMITLLFSLVSVVFYLVMMIRLDVLMALVVVGILLANFGINKLSVFLNGKYHRASSGPDAGKLANDEFRISAQGLAHIEAYKSTASEGYLFQRVMSSKHALARARRASDYTNAYRPVKSLPGMFFLNALLLISAVRIMNRSFTIGAYLAFQAYAVAFFGPFSSVLGAKSIFDKAEKKLEGLFQSVGNAETEVPETVDILNTQRLSGAIFCESVSYCYPGAQEPALEQFDLSMKPGQRVAILGKSGAGKSTLVKLLQGLYTPSSGTISMDGLAPDQMEPVIKRLSIGSANQNLTLFTASVRNNITLWDDSITQAEVYRAARDVRLHDDIALLERGYDFEVGERGYNFSGGQRQKMELARALLYRPSIVILDEATSSIDPAAREAVERNLLERGCSVVAVTHLISHITDYDEIIVLDKGRVQHRGTHEELLAKSAYYASVYKEEMEVAAL